MSAENDSGNTYPEVIVVEGRKKSDVRSAGKYQSAPNRVITVKMPIWLIEEMDQAAERMGYHSRSALIKDAIIAFLSDSNEESKKVAILYMRIAGDLIDTALALLRQATEHVENAAKLSGSPAAHEVLERIVDAMVYANRARAKLASLTRDNG